MGTTNKQRTGPADETLYHALLQCDHAKLFWSASMDYFGFRMPRLDPATWVRDVLVDSNFSKEQVPIAVTVMWCIWTSRNKYVHGEEKYQPLGSMQLIEEQLALLELPPTQAKVQKKECRWNGRNHQLGGLPSTQMVQLIICLGWLGRDMLFETTRGRSWRLAVPNISKWMTRSSVNYSTCKS